MSEIHSGKKRTKKDDPLEGLYQLDESVHLEEKALVLMIKMLDNFEEFNELSGHLNTIMKEDDMMGTRMLSLLKVLINGIQNEYQKLGYLGY